MTTAPQWVPDATFYQIFPDRMAKGIGSETCEVRWFEDWESPPDPFGFKGGNLWGVIEELDRIRSLGFNALYFTPVFSSPANHRYHTHDYYTIDPILGGNVAFEALLREAHSRKMRVVLDGVFNHTGRSFFAFAHILENGLASPYLEWYHINRRYLEDHGTLNAYPGHVDAQSVSSFETFGYKSWYDLPALPKLNTENPEVQEYIFCVAEHWAKMGIDGWRLDVPTEIQTSGFWETFRQRVRACNPECYIVGEIWHEAPEYLKGDRFDGLMNYPLGSGIMRWTFSRFNEKLAATAPYRDLPKFHSGTEFAGFLNRVQHASGQMGLSHQLNLLTSHDTPRLASLAGHQTDDAAQALTLLFTLPGAPCLYYGDEYSLTGGMDPDCRGTIPSSAIAQPPPIYALVKDLLNVRHAAAAFRSEEMQFHTFPDFPWLRSDKNLVIVRGESAAADTQQQKNGLSPARVIINRESEPLCIPADIWNQWNHTEAAVVTRSHMTKTVEKGTAGRTFSVPEFSTLIAFSRDKSL